MTVTHPEESARFLPLEPESSGSRTKRSTFRKQWTWTTCGLHIGLIALYTICSLWAIRHNSCTAGSMAGPLSDLKIDYARRVFVNLTDDNPFAGPPSDQVDEAWDHLLGTLNIRVSAAELALNEQESVALPEGGYLAWLGASHELHCIKMLREWKYRDHYHPNLTDVEYTHWDSHADHCLDLLRQTALCHASTALTTFVWNETKPKPMFDARRSSQMCVDWDVLMSSTAGRAVSVAEIRMMKNPLTQEE